MTLLQEHIMHPPIIRTTSPHHLALNENDHRPRHLSDGSGYSGVIHRIGPEDWHVHPPRGDGCQMGSSLAMWGKSFQLRIAEEW